MPSGYRNIQVPRMSPEQMQLFNMLLGGANKFGATGLDLLGKYAMGDQESLDALFQPSINQFNQQVIPGIARRFAQGGGLQSSDFNNAVAGAAGNLSAELGAQRVGIQQSALDRLMKMQQDLLGYQPFENILEKKKGWWDYFQDFNSSARNNLGLIMGAMRGGGI